MTVRNFVGGELNIMHHSDVDPRGVINAGIADKAKKYAKPIADREIADTWALVLNAKYYGHLLRCDYIWRR